MGNRNRQLLIFFSILAALVLTLFLYQIYLLFPIYINSKTERQEFFWFVTLGLPIIILLSYVIGRNILEKGSKAEKLLNPFIYAILMTLGMLLYLLLEYFIGQE